MTTDPKLFFSSDPHYWHANVIKHANRPFSSVEEMNEELIRRWNERVTSRDIIYLLGDVFFCNKEEAMKIMARLNGQIHWIFGNHDAKSRKWKDLTDMCAWTGDVKEIKVRDPDGEFRKNTEHPPKKPYNKIRMFHEPIASWIGMHKGSWHLHGHSHGTYKIQHGKLLDVGVDVHNYAPISYQEVKRFMRTRTFKPVDGHGLRKEQDNGTR